MVGEDATSVFVTIMMKLVELLEKERDRGRNNNQQSNQKDRSFKIKGGSLTKHQFQKLTETGVEFESLRIPKSDVNGINEIAKEMNCSYFSATDNGNTAVVLVPKSQLNVYNTAMALYAEKQLSRKPDSYVADKNRIHTDKEADIIDALKSEYNCPTLCFKTASNEFVDVVKKEDEGTYKAVLAKSKEMMEKLKDFDFIPFDNIKGLSNCDFSLRKVDISTAQMLKAADIDVEFTKGEKDIYAKINNQDILKADEIISGVVEGKETAEKFIADIIDNKATVNLLKMQEYQGKSIDDKDFYVLRIPQSDNYLKIPRNEAVVTDKGKTVSFQIDLNKEYAVYGCSLDKNQNVITHNTGRISGVELAANYNTRSMYETAIKENQGTIYQNYIDNNIQRVDLYSKEKNMLIKLEITDSDSMNEYLTDVCKLSESAANELIDYVHKELTEANPTLAEKMKYQSNQKSEDISFKDAKEILQNNRGEVIFDFDGSTVPPTIDELYSQINIYDNVKAYVNLRENELCEGQVCCLVRDNKNHKYTVISENEVQDKAKGELSKLGLSGEDLTVAAAVTERVQGRYESYIRTSQTAVAEKTTESKSFTNNKNIELSQCAYVVTSDKDIVIVRDNNESDNINYCVLTQGMTRTEMTSALKDDLQLSARASLGVVEEMESLEAISAAKSDRIGTLSVSQITADYMKISDKNDRVIGVVSKEDLTEEKLKKLGLTDKQAKSVILSVNKTAESTEKFAIKRTLNQLKNVAEKAVEKVGTVAERSQTKEKQDISQIGR